MTEEIKALVEASGKTEGSIYYHAKKLGRLPTADELLQTKRGRKKKYCVENYCIEKGEK